MLRDTLTGLQATAPSPLLQHLSDEFGDHGEEFRLLTRAVAESPPHLLRDGGVIAAGYDAELDELRLLAATRSSICWIWSAASASAPGFPASSSASIGCKVSSSKSTALKRIGCRKSICGARP